MDDDVAVVLLLQLRDLGAEVAFQDGRVLPFGRRKSRRNDIFRHGVELVRELAVARWPRCGEPLVGLAPEEERVGRKSLVELELVAFVSTGDFEAPTSVPEVLAPARVLHNAVQRGELGHDDPAHRFLLFAEAYGSPPGFARRPTRYQASADADDALRNDRGARHDCSTASRRARSRASNASTRCFSDFRSTPKRQGIGAEHVPCSPAPCC